MCLWWQVKLKYGVVLWTPPYCSDDRSPDFKVSGQDMCIPAFGGGDSGLVSQTLSLMWGGYNEHRWVL